MLVLRQLPDCLLDRLLHPGIQCRLSRLQLAGLLLERGLLLRRFLTEGLKRLELVLKRALHAGGERFPPCKGLPLLLEVHLGNSLLAGSLLHLLAPSMQRLGEFIELLPADLESLAASLELGLLLRP